MGIDDVIRKRKDNNHDNNHDTWKIWRRQLKQLKQLKLIFLWAMNQHQTVPDPKPWLVVGSYPIQPLQPLDTSVLRTGGSNWSNLRFECLVEGFAPGVWRKMLQFGMVMLMFFIRHMGVLHRWRYPIAGWFIMENPSINDYKWMIWRYPRFRKSPYDWSSYYHILPPRNAEGIAMLQKKRPSKLAHSRVMWWTVNTDDDVFRPVQIPKR